MNYYESMRAILVNPDSQEQEKTEAVASLRRLSETGNLAATQVLNELGMLGPRPSAYSTSKAKQIINDPASTPEQREAAWIKLKTPEDIPGEVRALERELLEELSRACIADVEGFEIHTFCTEKQWKNPAVKSLWFDRWLPAYWRTEQGSRKLAELETYGQMHNDPSKRSQEDLERFAVIAELRRRIRVDREFCGMLATGASEGQIPIEFISSVCFDIWKQATLFRTIEECRFTNRHRKGKGRDFPRHHRL